MTLLVETRKVQRLGSSSLVVTIPKTWAKKNRLKPGDPIFLVDEGGYLKIIPGSNNQPCLREELSTKYTSTLKDTGLEDILKCAYLNGYSSVRVKYAISYQNPAEIIEEASKYSFVETVREELDNVIIVFREEDSDPYKYLRRLFVEYYNLLETIRESFKTGEDNSLKTNEIIKEMNRLHDRYRLSLNKLCQKTVAREGDKMSRHSASSLLGILPRILGGLSSIVAKYAGHKNVDVLLNKLGIALQEALGSYVSESMKRSTNYRRIRSSLIKLLEDMKNQYMDLYVKVEDIITVLDELSANSVCLSLRNQD